jgi:hypothetical protein
MANIEFKEITKETDLSKIYKLEWDLEFNNKPFTIYRIDGHYHVMGGKYNNNCFWCCPSDESPSHKNLIPFNGSAPTWGVIFEETNYFGKRSIKQGGNCYITRNNKKFYEVMGRDVNYCLSKAQYLLVQIQEHPISFSSKNWKNELIGRLIYFYDDPAIVTSVIEDQGCLWIEPDRKLINSFSPKQRDLNDEDCHWYEEFKNGCKVDYLDPHIWWFRNYSKLQNKHLIITSEGIL